MVVVKIFRCVIRGPRVRPGTHYSASNYKLDLGTRFNIFKVMNLKKITGLIDFL